MELRHLRYFVAVAGEENVSRAALRLHVSQPALSRQIRDLEDEIGFALLERTAKSVHLTEAGRAFLDEARAILARVDEGVRKAREVAEGEGNEIHVGFAPSLTIEILPRALRAFQASHPKVKVRLHDLSTEEMLEALGRDRIDLALIVRPSKAMLRGFHFVEIARYALSVAIPPTHHLARHRSVALRDLTKENFVGYSRAGYPEYPDFFASLFEPNRVPKIVEEQDGVTSLIAAVESGKGIAIAPDSWKCMVGPRLKLIPLKPSPPPIIVGAAWKTDPLPLVAGQFLNAAR